MTKIYSCYVYYKMSSHTTIALIQTSFMTPIMKLVLSEEKKLKLTPLYSLLTVLRIESVRTISYFGFPGR